jgi:hypothetical protein
MGAEIVHLRPANQPTARVEPDVVLDSAKGELSTVVVLGLTRNGDLYLAASDGSERAYFLMERAKFYLLDHQR